MEERKARQEGFLRRNAYDLAIIAGFLWMGLAPG
jgi:hypothetical protein